MSYQIVRDRKVFSLGKSLMCCGDFLWLENPNEYLGVTNINWQILPSPDQTTVSLMQESPINNSREETNIKKIENNISQFISIHR